MTITIFALKSSHVLFMSGIFVFDASDGSKRRNVLSRTCVDVDGKNVKIFRDESQMILSFAKLVQVSMLSFVTLLYLVVLTRLLSPTSGHYVLKLLNL